MRIGVLPLGRDNPPVEVEVPSYASLRDLKNKISQELNIPTEDIRLSYLGRALDDDNRTLTSYGINDGAIVNIVEAPPGGIVERIL